MKYLAFLVCLLLATPSWADLKISELPGAGAVTGADTCVIVQNGTTKKCSAGQFTGGALDTLTAATSGSSGLEARTSSNNYTLVSTLSSLCGTVLTGDKCTAIFGFADPRNYGGFCDDNNGGNNFHDDSAGIMAAQANSLNAPVLIPLHFCKIASGVQNARNGSTLFSFPHAADYDANTVFTQPYLEIPNNLSTTTTNCALDINGYDSNGFYNLTMRANFGTGKGSVGYCNSFSGGSRNAAHNFTVMEHISIGNMNGIGTASTQDNLCQPTGTLGNNIIQLTGHDIKMANGCTGIWTNLGDTWIDTLICSSIKGPCLSTIDGFSSGTSISNFRCEFNGNENSGTSSLTRNGACIYWNAAPITGLQIANLNCDYNRGPCLDVGPRGGNVMIANMSANMSGSNAYGDPTQAHVLIEGQHSGVGQNTKDVSIKNFMMITGNYDGGTMTKYGVETVDSPDMISVDFVDATTGFTTSLYNLANPITHFKVTGNGTSQIINGDALGVGTTAPLNSSKIDARGPIAANGIISNGTKFTTSGCSISATTGGATAGTFTLGTNSCTAVVTMNGATGFTAPTGWACSAWDRTAPTILIGGNSATSATTASFTIPAGAGATDVIAFNCLAY